jgi:5-(carboxyamino)imidazole ribonucleotide synthase
MGNILGDAWKTRAGAVEEPNWQPILADPAAKLHLYGKPEARHGRKMGHFTVQGGDVEAALARARQLKARL